LFPPTFPNAGSFIGGYSVASLTFGHLVHVFPPFRLISVGMAIWCGAVVLCGLAPHYWVLVLGRVLSGFGEASFQCVVPPFIDDFAPPHLKGLCLAIFYMAIPVGTASGYAYGGAMASTRGWRWAFLLEAVPMAPVVLLLWFVQFPEKRNLAHGTANRVPHRLHAAPSKSIAAAGGGDAAGQPLLTTAAEDAALLAGPTVGGKAGGHADADHPTFLTELRNALCSKTYLAVVFGYAGLTAVTSGVGTFIASFCYYMGMLSTTTKASVITGIVVSAAGVIGTPLGGWMLDVGKRRLIARLRESAEADRTRRGLALSPRVLAAVDPYAVPLAAAADSPLVAAEEERLKAELGFDPLDVNDPLASVLNIAVAMAQSVWLMILGTGFLLLSLFLAHFGLGPFLAALYVGILLVMGTTAAVNQSMMAAVPHGSRAFGVGLGSMMMHVFGDVPAPPLIGGLMDKLAPPQNCDANGDHCTRDSTGLRNSLLITCGWLVWPIIMWALAWAFSSRRLWREVARAARSMPVEDESSIGVDGGKGGEYGAAWTGSYHRSSDMPSLPFSPSGQSVPSQLPASPFSAVLGSPSSQYNPSFASPSGRMDMQGRASDAFLSPNVATVPGSTYFVGTIGIENGIAPP
jgi:MFS family permease